MSTWLAWQVVDSAFPTGAFAHSWGLESAWQHGEIEDAGDVRRAAEAVLLQTSRAVVPFVNDAYRRPERYEELDAIAEAFLTTTVANRASRTQGRALMATAMEVWPSSSMDHLSARARVTCAHVAPMSGMVFRLVGLPLETVQRALLYGGVRTVLSAAVRLGIVGSFEGQRIQHECGAALDAAAARCAGLTIDALAQPTPLLDLFQGRHDGLYSRLFQS